MGITTKGNYHPRWLSIFGLRDFSAQLALVSMGSGKEKHDAFIGMMDVALNLTVQHSSYKFSLIRQHPGRQDFNGDLYMEPQNVGN